MHDGWGAHRPRPMGGDADVGIWQPTANSVTQNLISVSQSAAVSAVRRPAAPVGSLFSAKGVCDNSEGSFPAFRFARRHRPSSLGDAGPSKRLPSLSDVFGAVRVREATALQCWSTFVLPFFALSTPLQQCSPSPPAPPRQACALPLPSPNNVTLSADWAIFGMLFAPASAAIIAYNAAKASVAAVWRYCPKAAFAAGFASFSFLSALACVAPFGITRAAHSAVDAAIDQPGAFAGAIDVVGRHRRKLFAAMDIRTGSGFLHSGSAAQSSFNSVSTSTFSSRQFQAEAFDPGTLRSTSHWGRFSVG